MDNSTTTPMVNDDQPIKPPHTFSVPTNDSPHSQRRVQSYMATRNGGGDPVTALGVRGLAPEASVLRRTSQVHRDLTDILTLLERNGDGSGA
ncbi:hypothetical protein F5B21DRAFT_495644 [Xylaria acuta]|nr:hypothetical protein F5B21DRAFT_495644 [Xylaria acuta]